LPFLDAAERAAELIVDDLRELQQSQTAKAVS
jgi:hypothetical protein